MFSHWVPISFLSNERATVALICLWATRPPVSGCFPTTEISKYEHLFPPHSRSALCLWLFNTLSISWDSDGYVTSEKGNILNWRRSKANMHELNEPFWEDNISIFFPSLFMVRVWPVSCHDMSDGFCCGVSVVKRYLTTSTGFKIGIIMYVYLLHTSKF